MEPRFRVWQSSRGCDALQDAPDNGIYGLESCHNPSTPDRFLFRCCPVPPSPLAKPLNALSPALATPRRVTKPL
eukprot:38048-Chlamydomonas_euryale.AAC.1